MERNLHISFEKLCAKLRSYIQKNKGFWDRISVGKKWPQNYIILFMKVECKKWQILLVWENQQFRNLSDVFCFYCRKFSLVSI